MAVNVAHRVPNATSRGRTRAVGMDRVIDVRAVGAPNRQLGSSRTRRRCNPSACSRISTVALGITQEDVTMARVTAVFDDRTQAERAIAELRRRGIPDAQVSIVARRPDEVDVTAGRADDKTAE